MSHLLRTFALFLFLAAPFLVSAHVPVLVQQSSLHDIKVIDDPTLSQAFYGTLDGFPHTYLIEAREPFTLFAQVLVPDIEKTPTDISGIIIRETGFRGRVSEVTRMLAKNAGWESFYEWWGGDSYRRGGTYEAPQEPGVYRIEVSSPENKGKYVLVVGKEESFDSIGYFELIGRMADVKEFFGKSKFLVVQSPLVFTPLLIVLGVLMYFFLRRRKAAVV